MTRTKWWGRVRNGIAGIAVGSGLVIGSAATSLADPDSTIPAPAISAAAPAPAAAPTAAATPSKLPVSAPSAAAPTVAVTGGAATGSTASTDTAKPVTQGDVLDQLAQDYAIGAGGGQLSNLLKTSLKLRSMGFKPTKQYYDEIQTAMQYRPNQNPLISALKDTIAYQQKIRAQMDILQQSQAKNANSAVMGAGQMPADSNPGQLGASMGSAPAPGSMPAMPAMPAAPAAPAAAAVGPAEAPMP